MPHPKKSKARTVSVPDVAEVIQPKKRSRKSELPPVAEVPAKIEEEVKEEEVPESEAIPATDALPVSPSSVEDQFKNMLEVLQSELEKTRANKSRNVSSNVFRSLIKEVKQLKASVAKTAKKPKRKVVNGNNKSGLLKPVQISKEMANFAGWDPSELKSRVDVYRTICKYVKDHDLQNPSDRRQIVADSTLKSLLNYDDKKDPKLLTYCYLQTKMKPHFLQSV